MHEGRRSDDGFLGVVNKYWPMITSFILVGWVAFKSVTTGSADADKRLTIVEGQTKDIAESFREFRVEIRADIKAMRDEQRELATAILRSARRAQ